MGQRLTSEDFNRLVRYFEHEAFRLEAQPAYLVDDEREPFRAFLRGEPLTPTNLPYFRAWYDQITAATQAGRRIARVRIVDDPPTDYQRWEAWVGTWNTTAGENIRYLPRGRARTLGLPDDDWWLFDSTRLAVMRFDPNGRPLGGEIVDDPEVVAQHCAWRDLAVHHSAPNMERLTA
jgi:hypothetical protein